MARLTQKQEEAAPVSDGPVSAVPHTEMAPNAPTAMAPTIPKSAEFYYMHFPRNWQVLGGKLVPHLAQVRVEPGLNSVAYKREGGKVVVDPYRYFNKKRRQGWIILEKGRKDYSYAVRNDRGELSWISRWERAIPGSDRILADVTGFTAWCDSLVARDGNVTDEKPIPEIKRYLIEEMIDRLTSQLEEEADYISKSPRRGKLLQANLDVLKAELEAGRGVE